MGIYYDYCLFTCSEWGISKGYSSTRKKTIEWWLEYAEWFENLEYLGYSAGEVLFERSFTMILIILGIMGSVFLVRKQLYSTKKKYGIVCIKQFLS